MLQIRSGRCPKCKEEVVSDVEFCPYCGFDLRNAEAGAPARPVAPTPAPTPRASSRKSDAADTVQSLARISAFFIAAVVLTILAVNIRTRFFSEDRSPEPSSSHAILVQDAEKFREQLALARQSSDAPEAAWVLGSAMPKGKEILEITVRGDWKSLDYPTRLSYAARLAERWKGVHAPHGAYFQLLDESGEEIGGRPESGKVWVKEKHEATTRVKPRKAPPAKAPATKAPDNAASGEAETEAGEKAAGEE